MLKIIDIIPSLQLWAVHPDTTLLEAARIMNEADIGALAVINDYGQLIGIITERDLIRRVLVQSADPNDIRVDAVMTRDVEVIDKDASTLQALEKMTRRRCRHLPVMDGDKVMTMLSVKDLLRAELKHREQVMADAIRILSAESRLSVTMLWRCNRCGERMGSVDHPKTCPHCRAENSFHLVDITIE